MSIKSLVGAALLCSAFLASCHKEPQGMMLVAEGFGGSKAAVQDESSYWINGETVRINGADYTVNVETGRAYVTDVPEDDVYRGLYPNTLAATATLASNDVTVSIPSVYLYRESDGRQALDVPMAAYGTSGSKLVFKHLTAAVTVWVVNNFGIDLAVDSIVVTSPTYQLSGSRSITLGSTMDVPACSTDVVANRRVVVRGNGQLKVNSGDSVAVQVPVLPVGDGNKFTISVATHNYDDADMTYTYSRTQTTGGALARAYIGYAPARFGGVFSVSATKKVRFSLGNLQYYCSTSMPQWRFAKHQYDVATFNGNDYGSNTGKWIDLFGFATSGATINNKTYNPYDTNMVNSYYNPSGSDISGTNRDWGYYNSISNGGNRAGVWRTLTSTEWTYLLARTNTVVKSTINDTDSGMVILPDEFTLPSSCNALTLTYGKTKSYTKNKFTLAQWRDMEVAGAVFLPVTGQREGKNKNIPKCGCYWTSTKNGNQYAYYLKVLDDNVQTASSFNYFGHSVRVVRDVN